MEFDNSGKVSDEDFRKFVYETAETVYHPVGTCKMGKDDLSVVDPEDLRVFNTENLRVVDASVMPYLVSGNTNAPCIMIADHISDNILS